MALARAADGAGRLIASRGPSIETPRLALRRWEPRDLDPFAAINSDPEVMEHFPSALSRQESAELIERIEAGFEADGLGLWAVEPRGEDAMVGFVGLNPVPEQMPFSPAVEVGWRLARSQWGRGIATEAARAAIAFGFDEAGLDEIVSFAALANARSRGVMERVGMSRDPSEDFAHPLLPRESLLSGHVLYRLRLAHAGGPAGGRC